MYFWNYRLQKSWLEKHLKSRFSEDKLHGKQSQTLMKSQGQHLYQIY